MKTKTFTILLTLLIYIGLTGCGRRCEDFNEEVVNWMPYKVNDHIILQKNEVLDTLKVTQSEIYHTDKIGAWVKCSCADSYTINLGSDSLDIIVTFYSSNNVSASHVKLNDEYLSFSEQLSTFTFNDKVYLNVIIYKNNHQSQSQRFDSLLISKSIGIIGIIGTSEELVIPDDSIRTIDLSSIDFINVDC